MASKKIGKQTFALCNPPSIAGHANVVGPKEGDGPLKDSFDVISPDASFGERSWEKAEVEMQKRALAAALEKAGQTMPVLDFLFAGDLLNQCISAGYAARSAGRALLRAVWRLLHHGGVPEPGGHAAGRRVRRVGSGGDVFPLLLGGASVPHPLGVRRTAHTHLPVDGHGGGGGGAGQERGRAVYHPRDPGAHPRTRASRTPTTWALPWPGRPMTPSPST